MEKEILRLSEKLIKLKKINKIKLEYITKYIDDKISKKEE